MQKQERQEGLRSEAKADRDVKQKGRERAEFNMYQRQKASS